MDVAVRIVPSDVYVRNLTNATSASPELCQYYTVAAKRTSAASAVEEAASFGQLVESEVSIVDVTDTRSRAATVCACVATEAHSNEFLYDGLIEPLVRELRMGVATQAVVVINGSLASRRHMLFQPFEGLLVRAAHDLCRSGCRVTLSAVEQDEHNQLVDLVADQDAQPALMMMRSRIPTIVENTDYHFTSVEDATLHDLTEQGSEHVFANLRDNKLSDVHHQIITLVAYDVGGRVGSKSGGDGRSASLAQLPNRTLQFVSMVVNEQTKAMRNTRHCLSNAASLLESRASSVPFTGSKITFLLKPALLARQPGCWITALAPQTPTSKHARETFRDAFSMIQTAQRIHASKTGRFAFKSASSKALLRAPSIRKGSNSATALVSTASQGNDSDSDSDGAPAAAKPTAAGNRSQQTPAALRSTQQPNQTAAHISAAEEPSPAAAPQNTSVTSAHNTSASREAVEQKLRLLQQEVPPVFVATGRAPSEEPQPRDRAPPPSAGHPTPKAAAPLVRSKSASSAKDSERLAYQRQQFLALQRAPPGEIFASSVVSPRRAMLDAGLNTSMGVQSPPTSLLRPVPTSAPQSRVVPSGHSAASGGSRTPSNTERPGGLSEQYLGKQRAPGTKAAAPHTADAPAGKSTSVPAAATGAGGPSKNSSSGSGGAPRWEAAQQFETYRQVMEPTVARLRGDVEAYASEVKSLRAELQRREKLARQTDAALAKAHLDAKDSLKRAAQAEVERQKEFDERRHDVSVLTRQRNDATHKATLLQRQVLELTEQVAEAEAHHSRAVAAASVGRSKSHATMFTQTTVTQGAPAALQTAVSDLRGMALTAGSRDTSLLAGQSATRGTQTIAAIQVDDLEEVSRLRLLVQELRDAVSVQTRFVAAAEDREAILHSRFEALEQELANRDEAEVALKTQLLRAEQALRLEKADREREHKERQLTRMSVGTQAAASSDDRLVELQEELRLWHAKCRDAEDQADELLGNIQAAEQEREALVADRDDLVGQRDDLEERASSLEAQLAQIVAHHEREKDELMAAVAAAQQQQQQQLSQAQSPPAAALTKKAPVRVPSFTAQQQLQPPSPVSRPQMLSASPEGDHYSPPTLTRNSNRAPPVLQSPPTSAAAPPSPAPVRQPSAGQPPIVTSMKALPPGLVLLKGAAKGPVAKPALAGQQLPPPPAPLTAAPPTPISSSPRASIVRLPSAGPLSPGAGPPSQSFENYMRQDSSARITPPASLPRRSPSASNN